MKRARGIPSPSTPRKRPNPSGGAGRRPPIARGAKAFLTRQRESNFRPPSKSFSRTRGSEYQRRLELGVAREQARKDLPLSTYTEAYWKIDLHNLLHFLQLRMDSHAQWEIRQYAETIGRQIVAPLFPLVWEAFVDYRLAAVQLTRLDCEVIARLAQAGRLPAGDEDFFAAGDPSWSGLNRSREREECREKLAQLKLLRQGGEP